MTAIVMAVEYAIDDDDQALKIHAILRALGYTPKRKLADEIRRDLWAASRMRDDYKLESTEVALLREILAGHSLAEAAVQLEVSEKSIAWWRHALLTKTGASDDDGLRALARSTLA